MFLSFSVSQTNEKEMSLGEYKKKNNTKKAVT